MKNIMKSLVVASLLVAIAFPAAAVEINKGNKSYQSRSVKPSQDDVAAAPPEQSGTVATADGLENIAPAAGAADDVSSPREKSLKEEIRLPRK